MVTRAVLDGQKGASGSAGLRDIADATSSHALQADGGLRKRILVPGEGWETPEKGDEVTGAIFRASRGCITTHATQMYQHNIIPGGD